MSTDVEAPPPAKKDEPPQESFLSVFLRNLWSANTVTVTVLSIFMALVIGAVLMIAAALIAARWGVAAERKPLEAVCRPLAAAE